MTIRGNTPPFSENGDEVVTIKPVLITYDGYQQIISSLKEEILTDIDNYGIALKTKEGNEFFKFCRDTIVITCDKIEDDISAILGRRNSEEITIDDTVDNINPQHYKKGSIECIDAIEAALTPEEFKGFCKGQVFKYVWRETHKNANIEDLQKAEWFLSRIKQKLEDL